MSVGDLVLLRSFCLDLFTIALYRCVAEYENNKEYRMNHLSKDEQVIFFLFFDELENMLLLTLTGQTEIQLPESI